MASRPTSPQDKLVKRLDAEDRLAFAHKTDAIIGNVGCHQPTSPSEKESYKDFRTLVDRGNVKDSLLLVCKSVEGLASEVNLYANHQEGIVRMTEGATHLDRPIRKALLGHEVTHIVNKDSYVPIPQEVQQFMQFQAEVGPFLKQRSTSGKPLTPEEFSKLVRAEDILQARAVSAENRSAEQNHDIERNADLGGVILAAGPKCKVNIAAAVNGLAAVLNTMPMETTSLVNRQAYLRGHETEVVSMCHEYYNTVRKDKGNGGRER